MAVQKAYFRASKAGAGERRCAEKRDEPHRSVEGEPGDEVARDSGGGVAGNEITEEVTRNEKPRACREDKHERPVSRYVSNGRFSPCNKEQKEGDDSPCERNIKKEFSVVHRFLNSILNRVTRVKRGGMENVIFYPGLDLHALAAIDCVSRCGGLSLREPIAPN